MHTLPPVAEVRQSEQVEGVNSQEVLRIFSRIEELRIIIAERSRFLVHCTPASRDDAEKQLTAAHNELHNFCVELDKRESSMPPEPVTHSRFGWLSERVRNTFHRGHPVASGAPEANPAEKSVV